MTAAVIQARLGSRRFLGKALADLLGHPVIWWVITRVMQVPALDRVVLVCPEEDASAFRAVVPEGVDVLPYQTTAVRVAPDGTVLAWDVLAAFTQAVGLLQPDDIVVRVTGDCPLVSPEAIALTIQALCQSVEYDDYYAFATSESDSSGWPDGTGCEAFTVRDLRRAYAEATWPRDREHVTRWMWRNRMAIVVENPHGDQGHLKLSIDTREDLTAVQQYLRADRPCEAST